MFFNCRLKKALRLFCLGLGAAAAFTVSLRAELPEKNGVEAWPESRCNYYAAAEGEQAKEARSFKAEGEQAKEARPPKAEGEQAKEARPPKAAGEQAKDLRSLKAEGIKAYARLQCLIEYYFMQSGRYPNSLESLEKSFNMGLPKEAPRVVLGTEPVSGLPFVYQPAEDRCSYTLSLPKPELYADYMPKLSSIDWAWLRFAAEGKRVERMAVQCTENIEALATRCELYAKDHKKAYPANLAALKPVYMPRELVCPVEGKPYIYTLNKEGYTISCPCPRGHGLGNFTYNSEKGLLIEELKEEKEKE